MFVIRYSVVRLGQVTQAHQPGPSQAQARRRAVPGRLVRGPGLAAWAGLGPKPDSRTNLEQTNDFCLQWIERMREVRAIILTVVSRRELYSASEDKGFPFGANRSCITGELLSRPPLTELLSRL